MYKHILLAADGSELSERAMSDGIELAKTIGAKTTIISVILPWHVIAPAEVMIPFPEPEYLKGAEVQADKILEKVKAAAEAAGVPCNTCHKLDEHPWRAITDTAEKERCDLIVMGSHGRTGLSSLVLGSETQKVLANTKIPVLVHR